MKTRVLILCAFFLGTFVGLLGGRLSPSRKVTAEPIDYSTDVVVMNLGHAGDTTRTFHPVHSVVDGVIKRYDDGDTSPREVGSLWEVRTVDNRMRLTCLVKTP